MELKKLSEHIWYMPYESERDRPNLGYVKGDNWSLAIDAALCNKLADTIRHLNPQICMESHWVPVETDVTLNDLLSGV